jgi:bacterioferritin
MAGIFGGAGNAERTVAARHLENGAVTEGYQGDVHEVIAMLNQALATEIVCMLRYRRHYFMARGIASKSVAAEFMEHAIQEQEHADQIASRIAQLNGEPNLDPDGMSSRSHAQYVPGTTLTDMIREDLVAERIAIDSYRDMIRKVAENDPTTRRMLEGILATEEEHAEDMADLLAQNPGSLDAED